MIAGRFAAALEATVAHDLRTVRAVLPGPWQAYKEPWIVHTALDYLKARWPGFAIHVADVEGRPAFGFMPS